MFAKILVLKILFTYLHGGYLRDAVLNCKNPKYYLVSYVCLIVQVKLRFLPGTICWKSLLVKLFRYWNNSFYKKMRFFINLCERMAETWRPYCICYKVLTYALFSCILQFIINLMDSPYMLYNCFCVVQIIFIVVSIDFSQNTIL